MHYFEFGKRDATIYSGGTTSSINTGFDETVASIAVVQPLCMTANEFLTQVVIESSLIT